MNLMVLAPQHTVDVAPMLMHTVISLALESMDDRRDVGDLNMILGVSVSADQGRDGVRYVMSYQPLDAIICFGKTAQSLSLTHDKREVQEPTLVRFRSQLKPVTVVRLPAVHSRVWRSTETMFKAAAAVKVLLAGTVEDMIQPEATLAIDKRDLN